jgi:SAM-dependent methyltransferase
VDVDPRWWESFFGEDWLRMTAAKDAQAIEEVDFLVATLGLERGARILDVPCGHGRHTAELARRGYRVTGVDLNDAPLGLAREHAPDAELVQGDMRELPVDGPFDAVLNLWNSFGYFAEDDDNERALAEFARVAAPGGAVAIETVNPFYLHANLRPHSWNELPDGSLLLDDRELDPVSGRTNTIATLVAPDGSRRDLPNSIRLYTVPELGSLCRRAGLEVERVYAGYEDVPFTGESFRYILVARKPR